MSTSNRSGGLWGGTRLQMPGTFILIDLNFAHHIKCMASSVSSTILMLFTRYAVHKAINVPVYNEVCHIHAYVVQQARLQTRANEGLCASHVFVCHACAVATVHAACA